MFWRDTPGGRLADLFETDDEDEADHYKRVPNFINPMHTLMWADRCGNKAFGVPSRDIQAQHIGISYIYDIFFVFCLFFVHVEHHFQECRNTTAKE